MEDTKVDGRWNYWGLLEEEEPIEDEDDINNE